jgi:hypothetical protein
VSLNKGRGRVGEEYGEEGVLLEKEVESKSYMVEKGKEGIKGL